MKLNIFVMSWVCAMPLMLSALTTTDLHRSFWADYNQFRNNHQVAYQWYKSLLENRNRPGYMFKGLVHLLHQTNNTEQILLLMPEIEPAFKDDIDIQLLLAQTLQQAGRQEEADKKYMQLLEKAKDNQQIVFQAAQIYLRRKEPENALQTIKEYLALAPGNPNNFIFHFLAAQVHISLDKKKEALEAIQQSLELHPGFDKGWLMSALLYEQDGQLNKAIESYNTYREVTGTSSAHLQEHLSRLVLQEKMQQTSLQLQSQHNDYDQALVEFNTGSFPEALQAIERSVTAHPKHIDGKVLNIQILYAMGKADQATAHLAAWFKENQQEELWLELLHLIALQDTAPKTIKLFEQLHAMLPEHTLVSLYLADLYMRTQEDHKAIAQLKHALKLTEDKQIKAAILTHLGSLYYAIGQLDAMPDLVAQAQNIADGHAPLLNLSAYWYAHRGGDLAKAQILISQALAAEPNNPFFKDTQGYILYKQGDFSAALEQLEESVKMLTDEPLITKHLVKCYIKCGKRDVAMITLKEAHLNEREKQSLQTFMKKIDSSVQ